MLVFQLFAHDAGDAHGRVEGRGRGQHVIFFRQQRSQYEFGAGLAVAAGDADADEVRILLQFLLRIAEIALVDGVFHRLRNARGQRKRPHPDGGQCKGQRAQLDNIVPRHIDEHKDNRPEHGMHRQQALHALGQHQLFLRRHALIKRKADDAGHQHHGARDKIRPNARKETQRHHRQERHNAHNQPLDVGTLFVGGNPPPVAVQLIALQLEHVQVLHAAQRHRRGQHQHRHDHVHKFQHALSSKVLSLFCFLREEKRIRNAQEAAALIEIGKMPRVFQHDQR